MATLPPPDGEIRPEGRTAPGGHAAPPPPSHDPSDPRRSSHNFARPAGAATPSPNRGNRLLWWLGGGAIGLFLLCGIGVGVLLYLGRGIPAALGRAIAEPTNVTTAYFEALKAHDWIEAQSHHSVPLRKKTTLATLEATWLRREAANGAIERFEVTNVNTRKFAGGNTVATVTGTLHYRTGVTEPKIVQLVKEGDDWKLSALP